MTHLCKQKCKHTFTGRVIANVNTNITCNKQLNIRTASGMLSRSLYLARKFHTLTSKDGKTTYKDAWQDRNGSHLLRTFPHLHHVLSLHLIPTSLTPTGTRTRIGTTSDLVFILGVIHHLVHGGTDTKHFWLGGLLEVASDEQLVHYIVSFVKIEDNIQLTDLVTKTNTCENTQRRWKQKKRHDSKNGGVSNVLRFQSNDLIFQQINGSFPGQWVRCLPYPHMPRNTEKHIWKKQWNMTRQVKEFSLASVVERSFKSHRNRTDSTYRLYITFLSFHSIKLQSLGGRESTMPVSSRTVRAFSFAWWCVNHFVNLVFPWRLIKRIKLIYKHNTHKRTINKNKSYKKKQSTWKQLNTKFTRELQN